MRRNESREGSLSFLKNQDLQGPGDLAGQEITAERFEKIDSPKKNYKNKQASKMSGTSCKV
ncbi:hypothetical protein ACW6QP_00595 [Salegentibacter sp. HM20]